MNNDLISRSKVIEELNFLKHIGYDNSGVMKLQNMEIQRCISVIEDAPAVEPESKWGKWVISEIYCPNCLEYFLTDCFSTEELQKCPNCGAKMTTGDEEAET